uniref:SZT2 subunit of KICSTOR complex n=1 Tax=Anolis carolinensis TaxID=28377 RepID=A0A803T084_ANOCA
MATTIKTLPRLVGVPWRSCFLFRAEAVGGRRSWMRAVSAMAASERPDAEVEEAGQVYLLMKKDFRISRNVRLAWFLNRLHQVICAVPESELVSNPNHVKSDNELDVLSILPISWQPDEPVQPRPYLLVPSTQVTFFARQYRFVIELDLSPSTGIVDDSTGEIIFDEVFYALSRCLVGLLRPFRIPGSDILFQPEIFVTIQAYSSIIGLQTHQVVLTLFVSLPSLPSESLVPCFIAKSLCR